MIIACLVKEIQISTELRRMGDIGLVPQNTVDDLIKQKFEAPLPRSDMLEHRYGITACLI